MEVMKREETIDHMTNAKVKVYLERKHDIERNYSEKRIVRTEGEIQ